MFTLETAMAATGTMGQRSYLPDDETIYNEIFADSDSGGEENDFDGFSDVNGDIDNDQTENLDEYIFDSNNWNVGDRLPWPLNFNTQPGVLCDLPASPAVIDFFNIFIANDEFEIISQQTNLYANQYLQNNMANLKPNSRFHRWSPTSAHEMKLYFAVILAMGLVSQLDIQEYWGTNSVTTTPFFPSVMSRDRFLLLQSFFHLNDNSSYIPRGREGHQPLYKLGPVFHTIINKFSSSIIPHRQLSFDEGMVPWRGNLAFKVFNPDKPVKFGVKLYMLCDATNGYCLKVNIYTGKDQRPQPTGNGITYDLVMRMLRGYFGQGHILYCDRYFSSPRLFFDLWHLGVGATGTVMKNRGLPQGLKDHPLNEKGEVFVMWNGPLTATKYRDHKDVYLLSTTHSSHNVLTNKRDPATGNHISRPHLVAEYNKYMGGVDRADQMVAYYHPIMTSKWWKKVFFHILQLTVLNSYLIYKETSTDRTPMLQRIFRRKLVEELVQSARVPNVNVGRPRPAPERLERLHGRHFPGKGKSRNCVVCNNSKLSVAGRKRPGKQTSYMCRQCNIPLCVHPCFEMYHTKQDYVLGYKRWKRANEE